MSLPSKIRRAFILGAGLGTRLRPLTENLPKPLVPICGKPLVHFALNHLEKNGIREVIINTHHAAEKWLQNFPDKKYQSLLLEFRHEPLLLDTGGGLKNVEDFFSNESIFIIYNGDILSTVPLAKAIEFHFANQNLATMVLRSKEEPKHVSLGKDGFVTDIRGKLGTRQNGEYLFTGIHIVQTEIFRSIAEPKPESIITIYLELIRQKKRIGGIVLDEGEWSDIGTLSEYERINKQFGNSPLRVE
jgi:mannose-1-phosphate guanylyltransferase